MQEQELWDLQLFTATSISGINLGTPVLWPLIPHFSSYPCCCYSTDLLVTFQASQPCPEPTSHLNTTPIPSATLHLILSLQILFLPLLLYYTKFLSAEHHFLLLCPGRYYSSISSKCSREQCSPLIPTECSTCSDHSPFCIPCKFWIGTCVHLPGNKLLEGRAKSDSFSPVSQHLA